MIVRQRTIAVLRVGQGMLPRAIIVLMGMFAMMRVYSTGYCQLFVPRQMRVPCRARYDQRAKKQEQGKTSEHVAGSTREAKFTQSTNSAERAALCRCSAKWSQVGPGTSRRESGHIRRLISPYLPGEALNRSS
jgi:hypothetical protein